MQAILDAIDAGALDARIGLVLSDNPGAYILERARSRRIPTGLIDCRGYRTKFPEEAQVETAVRLKAAGVDLVCLAGFLRLVRAPLLEAFPGRILNIHPSLLPAFPSKQAIAEALAAGVTETGCTVHEVTADGPGRILGQERIVISPDETEASLRARINAAERILFPAVLASLFGSGH